MLVMPMPPTIQRTVSAMKGGWRVARGLRLVEQVRESLKEEKSNIYDECWANSSTGCNKHSG